MDPTTLIALFSFQLTIITLVAIVYNRDKLADKALSIFGRLSSTPTTNQDRPQANKKETSQPPP